MIVDQDYTETTKTTDPVTGETKVETAAKSE